MKRGPKGRFVSDKVSVPGVNTFNVGDIAWVASTYDDCIAVPVEIKEVQTEKPVVAAIDEDECVCAAPHGIYYKVDELTCYHSYHSWISDSWRTHRTLYHTEHEALKCAIDRATDKARELESRARRLRVALSAAKSILPKAIKDIDGLPKLGSTVYIVSCGAVRSRIVVGYSLEYETPGLRLCIKDCPEDNNWYDVEEVYSSKNDAIKALIKQEEDEHAARIKEISNTIEPEAQK